MSLPSSPTAVVAVSSPGPDVVADPELVPGLLPLVGSGVVRLAPGASPELPLPVPSVSPSVPPDEVPSGPHARLRPHTNTIATFQPSLGMGRAYRGICGGRG